jgi:hypothetical protein
MFCRKKCPRGNLVIVKNGDNFVPDKSEFDVDINKLAGTLWWYLKSRRDPILEASKQ